MEEDKKYLQALQEIHLVLQYTEKISSELIREKHKLKYATTFFKTLKEGGIIKKTDRGYKWNTIEPNLAMAKEALRRNEERERTIGRANKRRVNTSSGLESLGNKSNLEGLTKASKKPKYYLGQIGFLKFKITPVYSA